MFKNVRAYAVNSPNEKLKPFKINRRGVGFDDVLIDILYCGVCHTDIHYIRNDWKTSNYPLVPGHEIIGNISNCQFLPRKRVPLQKNRWFLLL